MNNVVELPTKKCVECGARANKELPLVSETGQAFSKFYCEKHLPRPLDEDGLRLLVDVRDAEILSLRALLLTGLALHGGAAHTPNEIDWRRDARHALGIKHHENL